MNQKLSYLIRSLSNSHQRKACPNCGGGVLKLIDHKYFITKLFKCEVCKLNFRYPVDSKEFLNNFYQSSYQACYSNETLSITEFPSDDLLKKLMKDNFSDKRNHVVYIHALLKTYTARVLDYGCSWGYSVHHLKQAGYDAEGFEISRPRAEFGKKIGVTIHCQTETVGNGLDLIMSNHAIEHIPVISEFIRFSSSKLKEDGIFVAFCPNGSQEYREREPAIFHVNWGFLHPNYLDVSFASQLFRNNPYLILTGDWNYDINELAAWDGKSQKTSAYKSGKELLIVSKPNMNIANT